MNMPEKKIISFPLIGNYSVPITRLLRTIFPDHEIRPAPAMTRRTLELGCRHSPEMVCSPFKYTLGNYIEALEQGADILLQTGMGCLFGYYGEVQEKILRELGYKFNFICFSRDEARPGAIYRKLREQGSPLNPLQMVTALRMAVAGIRAMDSVENYMRENIAFAGDNAGTMEKLHARLLTELADAPDVRTVNTLGRRYDTAIRNIPVEQRDKPVKIGIVGELYTIMEPFSNFHLERTLEGSGAAISRKMNASFLLFDRSNRKSLRGAGEYLTYTSGANGVDSVAQTVDYARRGYDGVVHVKAFGCTPELNVVPAMQKVGRDYNIPILNLSFDSHTSETGIETRLEAFMDMIHMRRT